MFNPRQPKFRYYIKLFKIDAEGYEPEVIKGALTTLEKVKYISVDFGHEKGFDEEATLTDVNKILYDKGYELIKFSDYRLIGLYENKNFKQSFNRRFNTNVGRVYLLIKH